MIFTCNHSITIAHYATLSCKGSNYLAIQNLLNDLTMTKQNTKHKSAKITNTTF